MLVNVGLSYYMEGEHSQGASTPRAFAQWTELGEASSGATVSGPPGVIGIALDSAKVGSGTPLRTPGGLIHSASAVSEGDGLKKMPERIRSRRVGVLGPSGNRCRLHPLRGDRFRGCRLGTVGRLWTERLMRLPCRMCPLGMGLWPGSRGGA